MFAIAGFIEPAIMPDRVFKPHFLRLQQLHRRLLQSRQGGSNLEKQRALEDYMVELFQMLDGFTCVGKDVRSSSDENDLIFQNNHTEHALLRLMVPNLLVQCRNRADAVDAGEMRSFKEALASRGLRYGVYVSVNGFTGFKRKDAAAEDAKQVVRDARRDGLYILLIDQDELGAIADGRSLVDRIWQKQS